MCTNLSSNTKLMEKIVTTMAVNAYVYKNSKTLAKLGLVGAKQEPKL